MKSIEELNKHEIEPCFPIYNQDGSFSVDGKTYLPHVECLISLVNISFYEYFERILKRTDFNIDNFELKITQDHVSHVTVVIADRGQSTQFKRDVARNHIITISGKSYLIVEIIDIIYSNKRVNCKCLSSHAGSTGIPSDVLIQTDLSQFRCVGDSRTINADTIMSAIRIMNQARYGGGRSCWFYDQDFNLVRSFDASQRRVVGALHPAEAVQIASQLGEKGGWATMMLGGSSQTKELI